MLSVRLPENLNKRLSDLADKTSRPKSHYVKEAIQSFLDNEEDRLLAISRLEKNNPRISLEEMEKRLGLDD